MSYPEIERRRAMLAALHEAIESSDQFSLALPESKVYELGQTAGLDEMASKRAVKALIDNGYIDATVMGVDQNPLLAVHVDGITDMGQRLMACCHRRTRTRR